MRALILSDIHANLEALTAVLAAAGEWDVLWNLGDMVGYGGSPNQVVELMRQRATLTVRGNHDRVCSGIGTSLHFNPTARESALWTQDVLRPENIDWLRTLSQGPLRVQSGAHRADEDEPGEVGSLAAGGGPAEEAQNTDLDRNTDRAQITLAHGSPLDEDHYIMNMRDAWAPLQQMATAITFVGHTHIQGGFSQRQHEWHEIRPRYRSRSDTQSWTMPMPEGTRHLINPGSVGQPRDHDWRAAFAVFDTEAAEVVYHRVPYDVAGAQMQILRVGLPERLAARLREGR